MQQRTRDGTTAKWRQKWQCIEECPDCVHFLKWQLECTPSYQACLLNGISCRGFHFHDSSTPQIHCAIGVQINVFNSWNWGVSHSPVIDHSRHLVESCSSPKKRKISVRKRPICKIAPWILKHSESTIKITQCEGRGKQRISCSPSKKNLQFSSSCASACVQCCKHSSFLDSGGKQPLESFPARGVLPVSGGSIWFLLSAGQITCSSLMQSAAHPARQEIIGADRSGHGSRLHCLQVPSVNLRVQPRVQNAGCRMWPGERPMHRIHIWTCAVHCWSVPSQSVCPVVGPECRIWAGEGSMHYVRAWTLRSLRVASQCMDVDRGPRFGKVIKGDGVPMRTYANPGKMLKILHTFAQNYLDIP